ncbi:MAG: Vms1/Ankzf1 family peptidyl-tRNA hydrolase [Chloroflexota bacterium]
MKSWSLSKRELRTTLGTLEQDSAPYLTVYMQPSSFPISLENAAPQAGSALLDEVRDLATSPAVLQAARRYGTGAAVFWQQDGTRLLILPPFPIETDTMSLGVPDTQPLHALLDAPRTLGVVLAAWGSYALGVVHEDRLLQHRTGTGHIHKEHKKGGSSQKRFARRTEEQKKEFLRRMAARLDEMFAPHRLDYVFFGGNRLILRPLSALSSYLRSRPASLAPRILDVRHADHRALVRSIAQINEALAFTA